MTDYTGDDLINVPDPEEAIDLGGVIAESGDTPADDAAVAEGESTKGAEAQQSDDNPATDESEAQPEAKAEPEPEPAEDQGRKRKDPQKRINALTRKAKEAEERAAAAEARLALMKEEQEEKVRQEKEQEILERRNTAAEKADLEGVLEASDELDAFRNEAAEANKDSGEAVEQSDGTKAPMAEAAKAWIDRNPWFDNPDNGDLAQAAMDVEQTLRNRGYEYGEDLYQAIDKVIANDPRFEDVRPDPSTVSEQSEAEADQQLEKKQQEKPNIPVTTTKTSTPTETQQPGQLTKFDMKTMRQFGLDPDNAKHRKAFLDRKN